jgi:hypothetical protein
VQRRTALAAASAISISFLAGAAAVGAHGGALGFGDAHPTSMTRPAVVATAPAPGASGSAAVAADHGATMVAPHEHDDERGIDGSHADDDHEHEAARRDARPLHPAIELGDD